ncbi:hypothetical protein [Cellulomonas palmilytica]|uniref:hypothetical protein n=1 Tax=Cellulomonas palmilytica TaxID=2608402 RepID=UPI001F3FE920|nr:hypothetical protein [Cellulomonas palmilytica]UJP39346.1 hypothetical protein F1D97_13525 [Cellulomonas palmilytica]
MQTFDWRSWVLGIVSALIVAGVLGFVSWLRRPRGHLQPSLGRLPNGVVRVTVRWLGAGEAWDVVLLPEGGSALKTPALHVGRLSDGNGAAYIDLPPGGATVVSARWRTKSLGRRAAGLVIDTETLRTRKLTHRDIQRGA